MMHHLDTVQHDRRVAITQEELHWSKLMFKGLPATTTPHPKPQEASREERMLHDFVQSCRAMADTMFDNSISPLPDGWAEDERLWDILDIIGFAFDYQLPNTGVERMIKMMKELSGGTVARINSLPLSWKTIVKEATVGVDTSNLVSYKYKVPEGLPVQFDEIPFILKSTKAIMQELLFDLSIMKHGDFFFGYPKAPGNYRHRQSTHDMKPCLPSLECNLKQSPPARVNSYILLHIVTYCYILLQSTQCVS